MSKYKEVRNFVFGQVKRLSESLNSQTTKALLAQLRRGIGKHPGEIPELWGIFLNNLPEEYMNKTGEPSREEWAIYTAITLFALHQQGCNTSMYTEKNEGHFGCAVGRLFKEDNENEQILLKLNIVAQSDDIEELSYKLRTLIKLLNDKKIPIDYVDLAGDIYNFQFEDDVNKVRLKWGQDFYRYISNGNRKDDKNEKK